MLSRVIGATVVALCALPVAIATATTPPVAAALAPLTPCRLLDTRNTPREPGQPTPSMTLNVPTRGRCEVPSNATSVAITIAVVDAPGAGFLTAWSGEGSLPTASNLNWSRAHETRANSTVVQLSNAGDFVLSVSNSSVSNNLTQSAVHGPDFIVDVTAAFVPAIAAREGRFVPLTPTRAVDTRSGEPRPAGSTVFVPLSPGVANDAVALSVNLTIVDAATPGFATVMPHGSSPTEARAVTSSSVNIDEAGQTRSSATIVAVSSDGVGVGGFDVGGFDVYVSTASHIVVDITGWFTGPSAAQSSDGLLVTTGGVRALDTRSGSVVHAGGTVVVGAPGTSSSGGSSSIDLTHASAVMANITMVDNADIGWLAAFPTDREPPPTSSVNADISPGSVANSALLGVGPRGIAVHSNVRTHVIVDIIGWFTGTPDQGDPIPHSYNNEATPLPTTPQCDPNSRGRSAIVDRVSQMAWLCNSGTAVGDYMPFTAGPIEDAPKGEYRVFFKRHPWHGGGYELQRFTAFTRGDEGGRVAFHRFVEMPESAVGSEAYRNQSSGCLRMRSKDAVAVWNFLRVGDRVVVLNNA